MHHFIVHIYLFQFVKLRNFIKKNIFIHVIKYLYAYGLKDSESSLGRLSDPVTTVINPKSQYQRRGPNNLRHSPPVAGNHFSTSKNFSKNFIIQC